MTMRYYRALIETGAAGNYGVVFPDFPGCVTVGDTIELALVNAAEVLLFHIEGIEEDGDQIPDPSAMGAPPPDWMPIELKPAATKKFCSSGAGPRM